MTLLSSLPPEDLRITHTQDTVTVQFKPRKKTLDRWIIFARLGKRVVGYAVFTSEGTTRLYPMEVNVVGTYQRRGIATAMYQYAQRVSGRKLRPSGQQTTAAQLLWTHLRKQKLLR